MAYLGEVSLFLCLLKFFSISSLRHRSRSCAERADEGSFGHSDSFRWPWCPFQVYKCMAPPRGIVGWLQVFLVPVRGGWLLVRELLPMWWGSDSRFHGDSCDSEQFNEYMMNWQVHPPKTWTPARDRISIMNCSTELCCYLVCIWSKLVLVSKPWLDISAWWNICICSKFSGSNSPVGMSVYILHKI